MNDPRQTAIYSDLEVTFRKRDELSYALHFSFNGAQDEAEKSSNPDPIITLDFTVLLDEGSSYGKNLSKQVFTAEVTTWFVQFRAVALTQESTLRVRLAIDASAPELHSIHWESLRDPSVLDRDVPLFMGEGLLVSRFLSSAANDWRPIRLHPKAKLKALLVVSNPPPGSTLPQLDVATELHNAKLALADIEVSQLASGDPMPPNLINLTARLREGFDILYIVCHGMLLNQEPQLLLDDAVDGKRTPGQALVQAIDNLEYRPRLIVLASCQSAGEGNSGLAALGPRLAGVGVPAVIAMQGNVYMSTASAFMKTFFAELCCDGQIDRAMSVARATVYQLNLSDYWKPVLFMRLRSGRIWYEPGFAGSAQDEETSWKDIYMAVRKKTFVPVLGPELGEELFRGTPEWAQNLAHQNGFPLGIHDRADLAKVTQFLSVVHQRDGACDKVELESTRALSRWLGQEPPQADPAIKKDETAILDEEQDLLDGRAQLLTQAVERCHADPDNPFQILSSLPASIYLNASYETILRDVLTANKKSPSMISVPWLSKSVIQTPKPAVSASPATPWVYHIFGDFEERNSMVLTEDNFFDYLIKATNQGYLAPVAGRLIQSSLLFLGFRLDDWRFRVLFRMILAYEGSEQLKDFAHVGVQVTPGEQSVADVNRARKYMESYFLENRAAPKISIYWGSATDFLRQLRDKTTRNNAGGQA